MTPQYKPGKYLARVINQALGKAQTGTPQFVLRFVILGAIDPANPDGDLLATAQYERTLYRAITEKTMPYFLEDLESLGYTRDSFRFLDPNIPNFHNFVGQEILVFCAHENDQQNQLREKWGIAKKASAFKVDPLENAAIRQLDSLFGKQLKALRKEPKPTEPQPVPAGDISDDDVPF